MRKLLQVRKPWPPKYAASPTRRVAHLIKHVAGRGYKVHLSAHLITTELLIMKKLVLPAMALAALALGTLAQVGDAEARRGYRGGGGVAYRGVAVRGPRGGVAYRGVAVGRGYRGGYGYYGRRGYGVPLAVGAVGAAAVGAAAAGSYYGYGYPAYSYPAYGYPACDPYVQAC